MIALEPAARNVNIVAPDAEMLNAFDNAAHHGRVGDVHIKTHKAARRSSGVDRNRIVAMHMLPQACVRQQNAASVLFLRNEHALPRQAQNESFSIGDVQFAHATRDL